MACRLCPLGGCSWSLTLSPSAISLSQISGLAMTPTLAAMRSPNDLDIARPGTSWCESQTLGGPMSSPFKPLHASTRPLFSRIRFFSSSRSGFWSSLSLIAVSFCSPLLLEALARARTARESPALHE